MWTLDSKTDSWTWVLGSSTLQWSTTTFPGPLTRSYAFFTSTPDEHLWIMPTFDWLVRIWFFNSSSHEWSVVYQMNMSNPMESGIASLWHGGLSLIGTKTLLLYGGWLISSSGVSNMFASFYIPTRKWTWISGNSTGISVYPESAGLFDSPIMVSSKYMLPPVNSQFAYFSFDSWTAMFGGRSWGQASLIYDTTLKFQLCNDSQYFADGFCRDCDVGHRRTVGEIAMDDCIVACSPGSIIDGNFCTNCSAGSFSLQGDLYCSVCPLGTYSDTPGSSTCLGCSEGSYSSLQGSSVCQKCPANSTTQGMNSRSVFDCICSVGFYGNRSNCIFCKTYLGVSCSLLNISRPYILSGYFRHPEDPSIPLACIPSEACVLASSDSLDTVCANGYTGFLCGSCDRNSFRQGIICRSCPSTVSQALTWTAAGLGILCLLYFSSRRNRVLAGPLKIVLFWLQILATFPSHSSSNPKSLNWFLQTLGGLNLDFSVTSPECSISINFWSKFYLKMITPFIVWGLLCSFDFVQNRKISQKCSFARYEVFFIICSMGLYTVAVSGIFSTLKCQQQQDGSWSLVEESSITCYTGQWQNNVSGIILFSIFYFLAFPCYLLHVFYRFRAEKVTKTWKNLTAAHLNFLRDNFKDQYYWWSGVEVLERLSILACTTLLGKSGQSNSSSYLPILTLQIVLLLVHIVVMPYRRVFRLKMNLLWNGITLLVILSDVVLFKSTASQEMKDAIAIVLIVTICLCVLFSVVERNFKDQSAENQLEIQSTEVSVFSLVEWNNSATCCSR
eukprot:TRINITY_DN15103_c0_g1_i2.p1 TRINITY_DN15103_c0_g1~~TRINITY_DN15103_c0_g1_i2.p1  ORF type:complete len:891 (-),score=136.74 TRINITY_DN15103_c0_g1_i2:148-2499(-)